MASGSARLRRLSGMTVELASIFLSHFHRLRPNARNPIHHVNSLIHLVENVIQQAMPLPIAARHLPGSAVD
ncbi:hypothetical protein [Bosea sp. BH3]|uniref:hypothetical protein n=1 Tax=Bosea sp. BH3 TaxID=2871701 RepID=UPI0021CB5A5A|nr:hypothetical protein [Bosea sp. BH3]MCU4182274.1 hypothetical protein [Bosea sp. BH3]